ncbi:winged helix-turn-helix transcriptional regulator [Pseudomonas sp. NR3]|uniref:winged helix-turn-helix transcriptional regulator n=1 Tax=Pseudomonas sp. NR3 TaxID=3155978 RepID=UPI003B681730
MSWPGIILDIVFTGKKTYGQFLKSDEGIATNVLASRLAFLKEEGILSKAPNPDDRRKDFYELTEKGIDLIPILLNIVMWSAKHYSQSYVRPGSRLFEQLSLNPVQGIEEVKTLLRRGGCIFPATNE